MRKPCVDADIDWISPYYHYPSGEEPGRLLRVCFHMDENGTSHIGKVVDGKCLYAIDKIDLHHRSWRKRYHMGIADKDYYILTTGDRDSYLWVAGSQITNSELGPMVPFQMEGPGVCLAQNVTIRRFERRTRGWHPGEWHDNLFECHYEYNSFGDKAPSESTFWSEDQVKILYVRERE